MATSSSTSGLRGFFAYYRVYARSGIHAASAAALTALIGLASFINRWFVVLAIAVYVLPPVFLYLTAEGERVPSVTAEGERESSTADTGRASETERATDGETDRHSRVAEPDEKPESDIDSTPVVDTDDTPDATATDDTNPTVTDASEDADSGWVEADVPTDTTLTDVVARDGAFAVGEGGVVLARGPEDWECVLDHGPAAESEPLNGVDATDDGERVWFAGDNGALGRYDVTEGRHTDHSAPDDLTDTWADVAVTGRAGEERLYLVNGSGEVLRGENDAGTIAWDDSVKPGSGSSLASVVFDGDRGYLCDTSQSIYETTDGGESYEKIGIEDANTDFTDIMVVEEVFVAGGDGSVFRYDNTNWTTLHVDEDGLSAIDGMGENGLVAGNGGVVYELRDGDWEPAETPTESDLLGVAIGDSVPDLAVGIGGTVIERRR